jgi:MFS family permease
MVSQPDPALTDSLQQGAHAAATGPDDQGIQVYNSLLERIAPWLFDVGSWIFGGLIAFTVVIICALLPVRPVDIPVDVAIAVFALALPLNVTGLVLLRIVRDLKPVGFEQGLVSMFQEAGSTLGEQQIPSLATLEAVRKRGTRNVLYTALGILTLSAVLTVAGMVAALWHVAWWIGVAFGVMVFICLSIVQLVMVTAQPRLTAEEKAERRRQRTEAIKQAKVRSRQAREEAINRARAKSDLDRERARQAQG